MYNKPFIFKQFSITQEKNSFKIGTDSILLGSLVDKDLTPINVLDIGTGTGILALMMAQKFPNAFIEAIDIQIQNIEECQLNFIKSPWKERMKVDLIDLKKFFPKKSYDLIVCNPPYFANSLKSISIKKLKARHQFENSMEIKELLIFANKYLNKQGSLYFSYPANELNSINTLIYSNNLHAKTFWKIKSSPNKKEYLNIFEISKGKRTSPIQKNLTIQKDNAYTKDYIDLTKEFYLKFD
jgi:tRNA1Val (adenine37-N6)-methyltransferase